jgi:hypothetical protein
VCVCVCVCVCVYIMCFLCAVSWFFTNKKHNMLHRTNSIKTYRMLLCERWGLLNGELMIPLCWNVTLDQLQLLSQTNRIIGDLFSKNGKRLPSVICLLRGRNRFKNVCYSDELRSWRPCRGSGRYLPTSHSGVPGSRLAVETTDTGIGVSSSRPTSIFPLSRLVYQCSIFCSIFTLI